MIDMEVMEISKELISEYVSKCTSETFREFLNKKGFIDNYKLPLLRKDNYQNVYEKLLEGSNAKVQLNDGNFKLFNGDIKLDRVKSLFVCN